MQLHLLIYNTTLHGIAYCIILYCVPCYLLLYTALYVVLYTALYCIVYCCMLYCILLYTVLYTVFHCCTSASLAMSMTQKTFIAQPCDGAILSQSTVIIVYFKGSFMDNNFIFSWELIFIWSLQPCSQAILKWFSIGWNPTQGGDTPKRLGGKCIHNF